MSKEGRRSQGRSPLCVTVFTFSNITKPHQQVLVSSWVLMVSTARSRGVPEGEGGRWGEPKNLEIQDCRNKSNRVKKKTGGCSPPV